MNEFTTILIVAALTLTAYASADEPESSKEIINPSTTRTTEITESTDWSKDQNGRSFMHTSLGKLPVKSKIIKTSTEITRTIDVKLPHAIPECESDIDLEYYQKDTVAEVRTLFTSSNCSTFDASYQLQIGYFNDQGELKKILAKEHWPKGQASQLRKSYTLEKNSELQRVTARILSCICNEQ